MMYYRIAYYLGYKNFFYPGIDLTLDQVNDILGKNSNVIVFTLRRK